MTGPGVAVVGAGWMGHVHARAYVRLPHHYPELAPHPVLTVVADTDADRREDAVCRYGFARAVADWREVIEDDDVVAVSVTAPNHLHREIGVAVAAAGRHLWIEKPVGMSRADAADVRRAIRAARVHAAVGFNYRNAPAVAEARDLVESGAIGRVTHVEVRLLSDYSAHPQGALSWRFERRTGGNGVLGDLVSHGIDLARFVAGDITSLVADTATVIDTRPRASVTTNHFALAPDGEPGRVENEDQASALLRFASGARGTLVASRVSVGDQNNYGFVVRGTQGYVGWDYRRMGELVVSAGTDYIGQSASTRLVGPGSDDFDRFQPGPGNPLSFDDLKVVEAARFIRSMRKADPAGTTIDDAVASATALDAMVRSVDTGRWETVDATRRGAGSSV